MLQPQVIQQIIQTIRTKPLNLIFFSGFVLIALAYASNIFAKEDLANFNKTYSDAIFLAPILVSILQKLKRPGSIVDPIYWLLLATAFGTWLLLKVLVITIWPDLSSSTQDLLTNLSYFLYFSLTIAAIEVKSYQTAGQLLTQQSLLVWVATLSFTLGSFIFLALTPSRGIESQESIFHSSFIFYILMDIYLFIRWSYLSWNCRKNLWIGYFLFALAALFWAVADIFEGLAIANKLDIEVGGWRDWIWYLSYLFVYIALQIDVTTSFEQSTIRNFSRSHLFNSPLFFVIIGFLLALLLDGSNPLFLPLNSTQESILNLWLSVGLALSAYQLTSLIQQQRIKAQQLVEADVSNQVIQQRMQQQAQKLESQSASNRAILETTHNAIFTLNLQGQILSCNPAASELIGYQEESLVGRSFIEAIHAEGELARFFTYQSYRQKLFSYNGGIEIQSVITQKGNTQIPVHVTLSQERNNNEGILVVSLVNISEQKRAEEEAHQLKDQFIANISHEFRTPLTIINGVLDNLLEQERYQSDQEQLHTAKRNGLRMVRMVEQLLELSRIANDPLPITAIDAHSITNFVCQSFEEIARSNHIDFNYQLNNTCWIMGNAQSYEKILFNLLSNAFKYTDEGAVTVTLKPTKKNIELAVKDTGMGIDEAQQGLIFERFHRVKNNSTQTIHGVGIGLALVKELCDAMLWELKIDSSPGVGSVFTLVIPIAQEQLHEQQKLTHNQKESSDATIVTQQQSDSSNLEESISSKTDNIPQSISKSIESEVFDVRTRLPKAPTKKSKHSVLIVEDNLDMQAHINNILSPYHHCLLADNGEEGLRLAIDFIPDIIVSDVMMPGISGFELLKTLKKTEITTHIPIILLTARSDSASKIRGLEAQADDYLSKPFDAKELLLRLNNQLNSREKLQHKLNSRFQQTSEKSTEPAIEDKFILKLQEIFAENYKNSEFSMLDLANLLAMSDRQAQRKIKALLGISPLEALKQFRLKEAKKQLSTGTQIGVVAQACGFSSQSYFGRCFKEEFEMTPKAFQQSQK